MSDRPAQPARRRLIIATGAAALATTQMRRVHAAVPGVTDKSVLFGHTGVLSGPLGTTAKSVISGASLAFDALNARGGVAGRHIELILRDDELVPAKAVANVQTLLKDNKVFGFFCNIGSATTVATAQLLASSGAPLVGGYGIADSARDKLKGSAYLLRATHQRELQALMQHARTMGAARLAMAYPDNPGGAEVARLFEAAAREAGLQPVDAVPMKLDGSDAEAAARKLAADTPQALIMYLSGTLCGDLMKICHALDFKPFFYGMSIVPGEATARMLGEKVRGLAISQVTPYPWRGAEPLAVEYRALAQKAGQQVGYLGWEGFLNAHLLIEALSRTGSELTRDRLHSTLHNLKLRLAGMPLDFSGGAVTGSHFVELVQLTAEGSFIH